MSQMYCFVDDGLFAKRSVCGSPERWAQMDDPLRCSDALARSIPDSDEGVGIPGASGLANVSDLIRRQQISGHSQPADYFGDRRGLT